MTSDISDLLEPRGWHHSATLQRFKTFNFKPEMHVAEFALQLLKLDISRQIHIQVTPRKIEQQVEVYLSYEPYYEEEVQKLLFTIENVYIEITNPDS